MKWHQGWVICCSVPLLKQQLCPLGGLQAACYCTAFDRTQAALQMLATLRVQDGCEFLCLLALSRH